MLIPTLEASLRLPQLVSALKEQTLRPLEIIVIDSDSLDGTAEVARSLGCSVYKISARRSTTVGHATSRLKMAAGNILLFMTDDAVPADPRFIHNLTRRLGCDRVAAAYARQKARHDALPTEAVWRLKNYPTQSQIQDLCSVSSPLLGNFRFSNVASAVLKTSFERVGRFPERIIMSEDLVLCEKLLQSGFAVAYEADAVVVHSHNLTLAKLARRYFDQGVFMRSHEGPLAKTGVTREGITVVLRQVTDLLKSGHFRYLPRSIVEAAIRVFAYHLGRSYPRLPGRLVRWLSANRTYWADVR